MLSDKIGA